MNQVEKLTEQLKEIDGGVILDVATGRGEFLHSLMESLKDYDKAVAIDFCDNAVAAATKFFQEKPVEVIKMDAYKMNFLDNYFDTVAISNSLHHFDEPDKVLQEMMRVLKPGGHILVSEMHNDDGQTEAQKSHILFHHWAGKIDTILGIPHHQTYTSKQLQNLVDKLPVSTPQFYTFSFCSENPKEEKITDKLLPMFEKIADKVKDMPSYDTIKTEGEQIEKHLLEHGFAPAGRIFFIGKK